MCTFKNDPNAVRPEGIFTAWKVMIESSHLWSKSLTFDRGLIRPLSNPNVTPLTFGHLYWSTEKTDCYHKQQEGFQAFLYREDAIAYAKLYITGGAKLRIVPVKTHKKHVKKMANTFDANPYVLGHGEPFTVLELSYIHLTKKAFKNAEVIEG